MSGSDQSLSQRFKEAILANRGRLNDLDRKNVRDLEDTVMAGILAISAQRAKFINELIKRRRQLFAEGLTMLEFALRMGAYTNAEQQLINAHLEALATGAEPKPLPPKVKRQLRNLEEELADFEKGRTDPTLHFVLKYALGVGAYVNLGLAEISQDNTWQHLIPWTLPRRAQKP
jgi:hypothetical protein